MNLTYEQLFSWVGFAVVSMCAGGGLLLLFLVVLDRIWGRIARVLGTFWRLVYTMLFQDAKVKALQTCDRDDLTAAHRWLNDLYNEACKRQGKPTLIEQDEATRRAREERDTAWHAHYSDGEDDNDDNADESNGTPHPSNTD